MPNRIKVMIVDDIAETREQLRKLLSFDPDIDVVAMVPTGEQAVEIVSDAYPDVILMDINLPGMDGITATGKVVEAVPNVQVIMLSVQGETDYLRRAMMAGARDYLVKPPSSDELLDAIHRAYKLKQKMGTGPLGPAGPTGAVQQTMVQPGGHLEAKVITVFSPKGGTGCTTLAVNLALALKEMLGTESKVCLIDGNLQFGDISIFMKLQPARTMTDLAPHAHDLDSGLLNSILVTHSSGVQVLTAPASPEEAEIVHEVAEDGSGNSRIRAILEFVKAEFDYVVIDTAHHVDEVLLAAMDTTDLLLVVTRPIIPEIRGARLFIELLHKLKFDLDGVGLVINGVDNKRMGIQPEAIERAMMPALAQVPLDERTALRAANLGEPVLLKGGRTALGQGIKALAEKVHDRVHAPVEEPVEEAESQRRVGLGRLL